MADIKSKRILTAVFCCLTVSPLFATQRPRIHSSYAASSAAYAPTRQETQDPHGLILLVQFSDLVFQPENDSLAFDSLANAETYTYGGNVGSMRQYFVRQSNGLYTPHFDVVGPITLSHPFAYYGTDKEGSSRGDDQYVADFVIEACAIVDSMGVDFTRYNWDGDSIIDFVYLIYAGKGQANGGETTNIWPHAWDIESALAYGNTNQTTYFCDYDFDAYTVIAEKLPVFDGLTLLKYACSNELFRTLREGTGTPCHEFSHVLGLPDYYITSDEATMSSTTTPGAWSLMSFGNYLNDGNTPCHYSAFDKYFCGWQTPQVLLETGTYTLADESYLITRTGEMPAQGALTADTIYYLENRQYETWDSYLPGHGLLIWQVVYDSIMWAENTPNDFSTRYKLLSASGRPAYTTNKTGAAREDVPFPGTADVASCTLFGRYQLSDIQEKDGRISFTLTDLRKETALSETLPKRYPTVKVFQNGTLKILKNGRYYDIFGNE